MREQEEKEGAGEGGELEARWRQGDGETARGELPSWRSGAHGSCFLGTFSNLRPQAEGRTDCRNEEKGETGAERGRQSGREGFNRNGAKS